MEGQKTHNIKLATRASHWVRTKKKTNMANKQLLIEEIQHHWNV